MLIQDKIGSTGSYVIGGRVVDILALEWYETGKRIMRKRTLAGRDVAMRFLRESPSLTEGDVLYADDGVVIVVTVLPCEVLVLRMVSLQTVASVCYEIGNRHLPLFYEKDELLAPYDEPLYRWLIAGGYEVFKAERKLISPLRSTVAPHDGGGLLSKILRV
jgi:urease accessory protein